MGLVGNIYIGKVLRVLAGIQAAFVDIGLEKAGFLHVSDMEFAVAESNTTTSSTTSRLIYKKIEDLLTPGQKLAVQFSKDPIATKGPRLTACLSLPGRYAVLLPGTEFYGVSQRITDEAEIERLKHIILAGVEAPVPGFIVRTMAQAVSGPELLQDFNYLQRVWKNLQAKLTSDNEGLIYQELNLPQRVLRDQVTSKAAKIIIDDSSWVTRVKEFISDYLPQLPAAVELYNQSAPIFSLYKLEEQLRGALERKVELKSGGYLLFEQTESMVTIDVNTGAYVGGNDFNQTILKTNLEAAVIIAWQLKLRNLGGIIIIDFIDMDDEQHQQQVFSLFEQAVTNDSAKSKNLSDFTPRVGRDDEKTYARKPRKYVM